MYKKGLIILVIAVLGLGNVYFYNQAKKLDYAITIGIPMEGSDSTSGIDFYDPISDKEEANMLIFSFMSGVSIEKPSISDALPDLTVWFNDWNEGINYRQVNMWKDNNTVVVEMDVNASSPSYKVIEGQRAADLIKIIEKYNVEKVYK